MYGRRTIIAASTVLLGTVAGCAEEMGSENGGGLTGGPDPRVTDVESERGLLDAIGGKADIYVLVQNDGDEGNVEVEVTILDANGNTLKRTSQQVLLKEDESRRVDFSVETPEGAERFEAEVESA